MIEFTPPIKAYDGYIFDCDGTLANSMPLHMDAWRAGIKAGGGGFHLDVEEFMKVAGMSIGQTIDTWNRIKNLNLNHEKVIEVKNEYFATHRDKIQAITPILDFAKKLKSKGANISVASGGTREDVEETLFHIGAKEVFDIIVTANDVKHSKPAPDLFLLAAKRMRVKPENCYVLEDSPLGIQAAEALKMDSILLPHLLQ